MIRARLPLEQTYDEIQNAVADIDRAVEIFNALLRLAEINSGVRRAEFRRVALSPVVAELMELYEPVAEEKAVSLTADVLEPAVVQGDPYLLAQAIGNLFDNAIKYVPPRGNVTVQIKFDNHAHVAIVVADNGPGIAASDKSRVIEHFYRGNRETKAEGIGLGLSIVDAVARLHGGTLSMEDAHPGLVATLRLPRETKS